MKNSNSILWLLVLFFLFSGGCSLLESDNYGKHAISSSLMDFLYPDKNNRKEQQPEIPVLHLPLKVGIAFVPSANWRENISPDRQVKLLERVKKKFINYSFIDSIEIIPSTYLKGSQGFDGLERLSKMYNIDVIALVSYDQVINNTENTRSLLYWTIVGMYVIKGNSNSINTFVDTAVFDIKSHKLLFRAPGTSEFVRSSTLVNLKKNSEKRSAAEFVKAVDEMIINLDKELSDFKRRVKEENVAKVENRKGYGGGSFEFYLFLLLIMVSSLRFMKRSQ